MFKRQADRLSYNDWKELNTYSLQQPRKGKKGRWLSPIVRIAQRLRRESHRLSFLLLPRTYYNLLIHIQSESDSAFVCLSVSWIEDAQIFFHRSFLLRQRPLLLFSSFVHFIFLVVVTFPTYCHPLLICSHNDEDFFLQAFAEFVAVDVTLVAYRVSIFPFQLCILRSFIYFNRKNKKENENKVEST